MSIRLASSHEDYGNDDSQTKAEFREDMGGLVVAIQNANAAPTEGEREGNDAEEVIGRLIKQEDVIEQGE